MKSWVWFTTTLSFLFLWFWNDIVPSVVAGDENLSPNNPAESTSKFPIRKINRTAVIISGQIRSANLSFATAEIIPSKQTHWFGASDPPTPAASLLQHLIVHLANHTGVDVFMYVTYDSEHANYTWNHDIGNYNPSPLDEHAACRIFSKHPIFGENTDNHFFCLYEEEKVLMTPWIANYTLWKNCQHRSYAEQVLQQLYGMYRANQAAIEYAFANDVHYAYKVRMRPDTAIVKPIPDIRTFDFHSKSSADCNSHIYYAYLGIFRMGNPDWFNIGLASDMDKLLNRYLDFVYDTFPASLLKVSEWILEQHLSVLMKEKYNICLSDHKDIWMIVVRKYGHYKINALQRQDHHGDWISINRR